MKLVQLVATLWFLLSTCAVIAQPSNAQLKQVDLELVLAVDVSGSVPSDMRTRQQAAFADAFRTPSLQRAMLSGPHQRVAVVYFEYAGFEDQRVVAPWTVLSNAEDMVRFAEALDRSAPGQSGGKTSISGAMEFARNLLATNAYRSYRQVVDIAGNGPNNDGPPVNMALQHLRRSGAIVNGLAMPVHGAVEPGPYDALFSGYHLPLDVYFRTEVIGGPGSFAVSVDPPNGVFDAILRKLVIEVAWASDAGQGE